MVIQVTEEFKKSYPHMAALKYFDYNKNTKVTVSRMLCNHQLTWEQLFSHLERKGWF